MVDFVVPGGSDKEGWQYAIDFPASYHAKKQFTDYVRRRRWYRKCRLIVSGPWQAIGNTKIADIGMQPLCTTGERILNVWAIATNGDALIRRGVTVDSPGGQSWDHVASNEQLVAISCMQDDSVWAIAKNGCALRRNGITADNPQGTTWTTIDAPKGSTLKKISVGAAGVWAIDLNGQVCVRVDVCKQMPEGQHWQVLSNVLNDPPHEDGKVGFRSVSVGDAVWAVSLSGHVCKRSGVSGNSPAGTGWIIGLKVGNCDWRFVLRVSKFDCFLLVLFPGEFRLHQRTLKEFVEVDLIGLSLSFGQRFMRFVDVVMIV